MQKKKKDGENTWKHEMISVIKGAIVTIVLVFVFLLVGAGLIGSGRISENRMESLIFVVCALSTFLTGVLQKSRTGRWTVPNAVLSAMAACLLFAGIGLLIWKNISLEAGKNTVISCVCGGGMAGLLFGKRRKKRRT